MMLLFATALLYIGCYAFYQAGKHRTTFPALKNSLAARRAVHAAGWAFAIAALMTLAEIYGWELGIPLWLAVFVVAGISGLLISALWPKLHFPSTVASAVIGLATGALLFMGGAA
ncbi:MAG: hypothetical protein AAFX04_03885 [Pseudomonadota bacterium]